MMVLPSVLGLLVSFSQAADLPPPPQPLTRVGRLARADASQEIESARAGDPAHPATRNLPSAKAYVESMAGQAEAARKAAPAAFIDSSSRQILHDEGCTPLVEGTSGIARADGRLNGYRIVSRCGNYIVDLQENDYRQPLTQTVVVHISDASVNADFGPGKALARYYLSEGGERTTVLSWYDGEQEVRLYAVGHSDVPIDIWNGNLTRIMREVVARRLASE